MRRILIAGIGNIFLGDDAFGCEVIRELSLHPLPDGVRAADFGIRSFDLACALGENYDMVILVDATARGGEPGTTYLLEIDPAETSYQPPTAPDAHTMDPVAVLRLAQSFAPITARLYLVGCEPAVLDAEDGQIGLSQPVRQAMPQALEMIESLVRDAFSVEKQESGQVPA